MDEYERTNDFERELELEPGATETPVAGVGETEDAPEDSADSPAETTATVKAPAKEDGAPGDGNGFVVAELVPEDEPVEVDRVAATGAAARATAAQAGAAAAQAGAAAGDAAKAVGSFFQEGAAAVKAVNEAKRAHTDARGRLDQLEHSIAAEEAELAHRRYVEQNYEQILADEKAKQDLARQNAATAREQAQTIDAQADALRERLQQARQADAATEKRLRSALNAAGAKESQAKEAVARQQRRTEDAKRALEGAKKERKQGTAAAQAAIDAASAHLQELRDEFAELQRTPSANSAGYSVRSGELQAQISDAIEELRKATDALPQTTAELDAAVTAAEQALTETEKPARSAKKSQKEATAEVNAARATLDSARKEAAARQKELRESIAEREQAAREQREAAEGQEAAASTAQDVIDDAQGIRAHPEATQDLDLRLAAERAERDAAAREVEQLAAAEADVRSQTRRSRYAFIAAVVVAAAVVLFIVALVFSS